LICYLFLNLSKAAISENLRFLCTDVARTVSEANPLAWQFPQDPIAAVPQAAHCQYQSACFATELRARLGMRGIPIRHDIYQLQNFPNISSCIAGSPKTR
jgi:hypothetical protein